MLHFFKDLHRPVNLMSVSMGAPFFELFKELFFVVLHLVDQRILKMAQIKNRSDKPASSDKTLLYTLVFLATKG